MTPPDHEPPIDLSTSGSARPVGADRRRVQVLALSGGGYRGLYSAHFLHKAEEHYRLSAGARFELLVGTSIGGLIAAALALDTPASVIDDRIARHGPRIFRKTRVWTRLKQVAVRAPYSTAALADAVIATLGRDKAEMSLSAVEKPLAISAVNFTHGRPEIFRSGGLAGAAANAVSVLDAVLASAAAPTYFPPHTVGTDVMIDGGLIANAPELLGLSEACGHLNYALERVYVMAVGTAARRQGAALSSIGQPSMVKWMVRRGLFQAALGAQEALAVAQCRILLGDRYYRVDNEPKEGQVAAIRDLDLTSTEATATLRSLAVESWSHHRSRPAFRRFFEE
jgi:uncharacterized protein